MGLRWYHFALWGAFILGLMALPELVSKGTLQLYLCQLPLAISWDCYQGALAMVLAIRFDRDGRLYDTILTKRFGVDVELAIPIAVVVTMLGA